MASVLDLVKHYQHSIDKYFSNDEQKVLKCLNKLYHLPVTVQHLQDTGVGRTVNSLRKDTGPVGSAARSLVAKWKSMVAAEESDQDSDYNIHTTADYYENSKEYTNNEVKSQNNVGQSTPGINKYVKTEREDYKHMNGDRGIDKRKYQSSEEEEPDIKKAKYASSSDNDDYKRSNDRSRIETQSEDTDNSQDENSESQMSEYSEEEERAEEQKLRKESSKKYKTSSNHSSNSDSADQKKEHSRDQKREHSSSKKSRDSLEKHSNSYKLESNEKYPKKTSSKESTSKSSSSLKHKSSKDCKDTSSETKPKSEHKSSEKEKKHKDDSKSASSSSDKSKSSSHKSEHDSNKQTSNSDKHSTKSEKHTSSSHVHKSDKDKQNRSSETIDKHKHKSKESSGKDKHRDSSKEKSKGNSSSTKDKSSDSHKKKHSSASDSKKSNDNKHKHVDDSDKKSKSSSSKSHSSSGKSKDVPKKKVQINSEDSDDGIDCGSGASFAEALGMISPTKHKKKSSLKDISSPKMYDLSPATLLAPNAKLAPLPAIEISSAKLAPLPAMEISALPEISPNYKPRPPPKLLPHFIDEDAMGAAITTKNQRTKVYSGNKTYGHLPTLYEMCIMVLQQHIDALEYTGGVPYEIIKPVVDKASPQQLFNLEHFNPYLMDETDHLWRMFCEKHFRNNKREEMETWREMYMRCQKEQERKLKSLANNIRIAQEAKNAPIKQTKMAYVDSAVKPPRNIARKQALHGTARSTSASPAARVASLSTSGALRVGAVRPPPAAPTTLLAFNKPKKAPLMQKALQFMRGRKR